MSDLNHTPNDFSSVEQAEQLAEQADALIVAAGAGIRSCAHSDGGGREHSFFQFKRFV